MNKPVMPELSVLDAGPVKFDFYSLGQMESHHAAWQAYAAGIRAEVLGEVRALQAKYQFLAEAAELKVEKHEWFEDLGMNTRGQYVSERRSEVFWHYEVAPIISGTVANEADVPSFDAAITELTATLENPNE